MKVVSAASRRPGLTVLCVLLAGLVVALFFGSGDHRDTSGPAGPPKGFVTRSGDGLVLNGKPWKFTGVNAYQLATDYTLDVGCGPDMTDPDQLFSTLPRGTVVRFWAFQAMADNPKTLKRDWTSLDRVFADANARGIKLAAVLSDQSGTCDDGHFHSLAWYQGGYAKTYDDNGKHTDLVSYQQWVTEVVTRYAQQSAIAYWEPVNEPEASTCDAGLTGTACYGHDSCIGGSAEALRNFFTTIGAQIHKLDRWHAVASGQLGQGECGSSGTDYLISASSPQLDIATVHDYDPSQSSGADQRIAQAHQLGKPLVFEETGTEASPSGSGCPTLAERAVELTSKARRDLDQPGVAGFLVWQWLQTRDATCEVAVTPKDPLLPDLAKLIS